MCVMPTTCAGYRLLVFVTNSSGTRNAVQVVRTLFQNKASEIVLAYCSANPFYHEGMDKQLEALAGVLSGFNVRTEVWYPLLSRASTRCERSSQ